MVPPPLGALVAVALAAVGVFGMVMSNRDEGAETTTDYVSARGNGRESISMLTFMRLRATFIP